MSVKIRLAITGKKNQIAYRIVATDTHTKRDGKFLEILGFYNPTSGGEEKLRIDKASIDAWVKKGAIITPAVALLIEKGTLDRPKKPKVKKEKAQASPVQAPAQDASDQTPKEEAKPEEEKPQEPAEEPKEEKPAEEKPTEQSTEKPKEEPQS